MARDASWGTHVQVLEAAKRTCGAEAYARWSNTEPTITNVPTGRSDDPTFYLSFPNDNFNFNAESVDHFVGVVAGDILLNPNLEKIEVSSFEFTDASLYEAFPGPNVGIDGLYNDLLKGTLGETERPILAFTVKPRLGMSVNEVVKIFEQQRNRA
jgi:ribulose 1,5-bisphosphate carboxylase large subunit-like protein